MPKGAGSHSATCGKLLIAWASSADVLCGLQGDWAILDYAHDKHLYAGLLPVLR